MSDSLVASRDGAFPLASLRHRFAAQVLDLLVCCLLFWYIGMAVAKHYGSVGITAEGFELQGKPAFLALGLFVLCSFAYFFLTEWLLGGSPGKLLCGLRVRNVDGSRCGLIGALIRNFLRPVDALMFYLVGLVLILTSEKKQRLGDRVGGTIVVLIPSGEEGAKPVEVGDLATWEQRTQATVIDFILLMLFILAYLYATGSIVTSGGLSFHLEGFWFLLLIIMIFSYYVFMEGIYGATVGKMFSGLRVIYLRGRGCDFTASIIRTVLRLVDAFCFYIVAFLFVILTKGRQRLGDLAAQTSVVRSEPSPARVWAASAMLVITALLAAVPFVTGTAGKFVSVSRPEASSTQPALSPAPSESASPSPLPVQAGIKVKEFTFSKEENGQPLAQPVFAVTEAIHAVFVVEGLKEDANKMVKTHADLTVKDPSGRTMLKQENIVNFQGKMNDTHVVSMKIRLTLPGYAPPGTYAMDLLVHDDGGNSTLPWSAPFQIAGESAPSFSSLTVADLYFSQEKDGQPLSSPEYAPGQTVWIMFRAAGLQGKDGDDLWLTEHIQVLAPDGSTALDKPDIIDLHQKMNYFPSFIPLNNNISLPPNAPKGTWTATIALEDKNNHSAAEKSATFVLK